MLEVRGLSVAYGQHRALEGASLRVRRGEIVVILGANGAGKSSLLRALAGICEGRVDGQATMLGTEVTHLPPHRIVEEGIALVPEGRGIFADLTVAENLSLGAHSNRARAEEAGNLDRVLSLFPKLAERRRQVVRTMSGGEQQMVAIGRAMMSHPQLLMLDEPSLGLSPLLTRELFQSLKAVRKAGIGILLVEQNARASLAVADRGYLLENGRIVHEGAAADLQSDPAVQAAYLGGAKAGRGAPATRAATSGAIPARPLAPAARRGEDPAAIAAAAIAGLRPGARPEVRRSPEPAPAPAPKPAHEMAPRMVPPPPRPAPTPTVSARPGPGGIDIGGLVERAATASRARVAQGPGGSGQGGGGHVSNGHAAGLEPRKPSMPSVVIPDLAESRDRLAAIMNEIEQAAARARDWRPDTSNRRKD